jgi:multidrug transporter EmrE-like cation transporter
MAAIFAQWVGVVAALYALAGWWFFGDALSLQRSVGLALVLGAMVLLIM